MKIDLHNHTYYSDGVLSPEELVLKAVENGVEIFALTDHDSVFGCEEIEAYANKHNVKVIKGLELSTDYNGESVHIICLFKDNVIPKKMYDFSVMLREKRQKRAIDMMNNIHNIYGLNIDLDKLLSESKVITRANMMRNIAVSNDMSYEEAAFYASKESKAYIPSTKLSVEDGLKLARGANCYCIFAHPCLIKDEKNIRKILDFGFDGIEVKYPSNKNNELKFRQLAEEYNINISAGSDCHGDETHADIGSSTLTYEEFLPIAKAINFKL